MIPRSDLPDARATEKQRPATGEKRAKKRVVIGDLPEEDSKPPERLGLESHDQDFEMGRRKKTKNPRRATGHKNKIIVMSMIQDQV
ncbi:MAG: hypothetical protein JO284_19845 [Planctomycetaceae bacterium]|nr:hypothetical protein [Planctomycetaceae bacterium]